MSLYMHVPIYSSLLCPGFMLQALSVEELAGSLVASGVDLKTVDPKDVSHARCQHLYPAGLLKDVLLALDPYDCKQISAPELLRAFATWQSHKFIASLLTASACGSIVTSHFHRGHAI